MKAIAYAITVIGRSVAWLVLAMTVVTFLVVFLRYGLNMGSIAFQELVMYFHAAFFMLGLSYTLQQDKHVRVDILYSRMHPRNQCLVNLLGHCVFLIPLCVVILVYTTPYTLLSWRLFEGSTEVGGIPAIFVLKTLLPMAAICLLAQAVCDISSLIKTLLLQYRK